MPPFFEVFYCTVHIVLATEDTKLNKIVLTFEKLKTLEYYAILKMAEYNSKTLAKTEKS